MLKSKKDLKIMQQIIENARMPLTVLARKTNLSREVVQYRLKQLEKNFITAYQARINLNHFAEAIYTIYLNIQGLERENAITKLKKLPLVHWISNSGGRWNYVVTFSVNYENRLKNFIDKLFYTFKDHIAQYTLTQHLLEYKDTFASLFGIKELKTSEKAIEQKRILDKIDIEILKELIKNCRVSNLEIAEKLNLTRETIRQRIQRLEKNEIIINYRTLINPSALELENYVLAIKCKNSNTNVLKELCNSLASINNCSYICLTAGEINLLVTISVKNLHELDKISTKVQKDFPNLIKEIEPLPLFEIGGQDYKFI